MSVMLDWVDLSPLLILEMTPGDQCLLNCDGTEELPEEWLVDCSPQESEPQCPPEDMSVHLSSPAVAMEEANLSG